MGIGQPVSEGNTAFAGILALFLLSRYEVLEPSASGMDARLANRGSFNKGCDQWMTLPAERGALGLKQCAKEEWMRGQFDRARLAVGTKNADA